jgi:hypothetical protein
MTVTLGFFTQHELDPVVGYRRRRERMEGKALPTGARVKTFSQEPIIFPEFAVMGLVLDQDAAHAPLRAAAEQLFEAKSFAAICSVVKQTVRGHKGWTLSDIAVALLRDASDEFFTWRELVSTLEDQLAQRDIRLHADVGRIEDVSDSGYLVTLLDAGEVIQCDLSASRTRLPTGICVTRNLIEYGVHRGEVLMPTVEPSILAKLREKQAAVTEDERGWDEMFNKVDFQPVVVPHVRDNVGRTEIGGDLVRPKRRLRVSTNRALYANANTMARGQQANRR